MTKASKLTMSAVFAALTCTATMLIKIPVPATQGYIHFGDAFVFLAGIFPGGFYGVIAAGVGSALADVFSGYVVYAPVTFAVKASCAIVITIVFKKLSSRGKKFIPCLIVAGFVATLVLTIGYFVFESVLYGDGAVAEIPMNIIQGGSGIVISCCLMPVLLKLPDIKKNILR